MTPFHLAFPVTDLEAARHFYAHLLGCPIGRTDERWIDFNFFGHQISAHLIDDKITNDPHNTVDGDRVPTRHFGAILKWDDWQKLAETLESKAHPFYIAPKVRFKGEVGEQGTFFIKDPCQNVLEFKTFRNMKCIFQSE
ncbi:MAG: VOC family protein [Myxococcota bacterium]